MTKELVIVRPDDWHLHLRDEDFLPITVNESAKSFARAIIMPNLVPPITKLIDAENYKRRILSALKPNLSFDPLMTLYLTEETDPKEVKEGFVTGQISAVKLYPAGATTNSQSGVRNFDKIKPILEIMAEIGCPLCIHGEVTDFNIDVFDREAVFIERHLEPLLRRFSSIKVVLEHITTIEAIDFVENSQFDIAATITPHHLHINRNAMFHGGLRSDFYCLPTAKREIHRIALRRAATSGKPCFFLGTDSAPHDRHEKESACGCAGVFSAHAAIELYAEAFEKANRLNKLEGFASHFGADFYGLERNTDTITLKKAPWTVPASYEFSGSSVVPFYAERDLSWRVAH